MPETISGFTEPNDVQPGVWGSAFVHCLSDEDGPVSVLVNRGIGLKLADNTRAGREQLARAAGQIFARAFIVDTGSEHPAEMLDIAEISESSRIPLEMVRDTLGLLVEKDLVKSNNPTIWKEMLRQRK